MSESAGRARWNEMFLRAIAHSAKLTPSTLWRLLDRGTRSVALLRAMRDPNRPWLRDTLVDLVHEKRGGFRTSTIKGWTDEQLAATCGALDIGQRGIVVAAIFSLHFPDRARLQVVFFDALGIPHEEGAIQGDLKEPAAPAELVSAAAERLLVEVGTDDALFYLIALAALWPSTWPGLREWLAALADQELGRRREPTAESAAAPTPAAPEAERTPEDASVAALEAEGERAELPPVVIPSETARLSPLDDQLIQTVVQVKGEIQNAPTPERLDAIIDEFTRLNGHRHQSFFLVGFRDALFGVPEGRVLPAINVHRRRWYSAGLVAGLRREHRENEIRALYERDEVVRGLGDSGTGPSAQAAHHVFAALCDAEDYAKACGFISANAVYRSIPVVMEVLKTATALLRGERPAQAAPMFDLLWRGLGRRKADGLPVDEMVWADVRRRRAHCLRYADDLEGARALLDSLLADPTDANRPAVLVDLGLMDAGIRRLADLRLPADERDRGILLDCLAVGEVRFAEAEKLEERTRSHASYVLGFRLLLEQEYGRARRQLEVALADFGQRPEVYTGGGLLARARLHFGLALCLSMSSAPDTQRGIRLVLESVDLGLDLPTYLVGDLFLAIEASAPELASVLAEKLLERFGDTILEAAAETLSAKQSRVITDALVARARASHRSLSSQTEDWIRVLPALLAQGRLQEADEALDALETGALQGILVERVRYILGDEREYGPAWTVDDATWSQARLAESQGEFQEAAAFLAQVFHRALAGDDEAAMDEARQVLERIADFGSCCEEVYGRLSEQYARRYVEEAQEEQAEDLEGRVINVLVVGGNEVQARFDQDLKTELNFTHPHIQVDFMHTGWGSNWGPQIEEFERRVVGVHAVVVSRYMRTMLGRSVRRLCPVPWRGCGGKGKTAFKNSILAAAEFGGRHSAKQQS